MMKVIAGNKLWTELQIVTNEKEIVKMIRCIKSFYPPKFM